MHACIRSYGDKIDGYVIARERLQTHMNLHGFLGQALLQYDDDTPKRIIDICQREAAGIDVEEADAAYVIRCTNDGTAPAAPVTEGGGMRTARRKVEAASGRMMIESTPRLVLTIIFERSVTLDV